MNSTTRVGGPARAPEQTVVYAIGDIHGRLDLLERLTEQLAVETEAARAEGKNAVAVFLGDYIDRGPEAAGVIDHLIRFRDQADCETVFLRGNHEDVLLSLLDGREDSARWLEYGGVETLRSYGVSFRGAAPNQPAERLRQTATNVIPAEHVAFLRATELSVKLGDYIFVHAGLRPDRLIEEQTDSDMMWFRYYDDEPPIWSGVVVHGHSVNPRPIRGRARIGIDTGAYATDALTALRLEEERQEFLKVFLNPEDGAVDIDFWDGVDRAFAGGVRPAAAAPRRREPAEAPSRPARRPAARTPSAKPAKATTPPGKARPFPAVGAAAAAGAVALAAATVAAVVLYRPSMDDVAADLSPQIVAAELRAETPAAPAPAGPMDAEVADAALRPLNPALAGDHAAPAQPQPAAASATTPPAPASSAPAAAPPAKPAAAQPPPAAAAPAAPASSGGARVQIAAAPSVQAAEGEWAAVRRQFADDIGLRHMEMEMVQVGERTLYRTLVAGFRSNDEARRFCDRMRQAGRNCIVRPAAG